MQASIAVGRSAPRPVGKESRLSRLGEVIGHAAHLLPAQGPITVFIHHNTLHAFEDLPFHDAVKKGAVVFGCQPYLSEDRYREALERGRIRFADLQDVLEQDLGERAGEPIPCFGSRLALRLGMLQYPLRTGPTEELVWYVAEANALRRVRREASSATRSRLIAETRRWVVRDLRKGLDPKPDGDGRSARTAEPGDSLAELLGRSGGAAIENWSDDAWERFTVQALWRVCCDGVRDLPQYTRPLPQPIRHRDLLLDATGVDTDAMVHEVLIRFCAAFLDQGMANWQLPRRDDGFYESFLALHRQPKGSPARWMRGVADELNRLADAGIGPLESILESLDALGVGEDEWRSFIPATFLALRGWGGMIQEVEDRGDRVVRPVPPGSLVGFLAVRLLLDRFALADSAHAALGIRTTAREFWGLARGTSDRHWPPSVEQRAFLVFQLAQVFGLSPDVLHRLDKQEWAALVREMEEFTGLERRRIFHIAYERRFYTQTLDAVAIHSRRPSQTPMQPRFQAMFCLDEREESLRRHLEEVAPDVATYGTAGFFSIAMYYRGAADAHFIPLCPAAVKPRHWVVEVEEGARNRRAQTRRAWGLASHRFHLGSRSFALGAMIAGALGALASIPLVASILSPRRSANVRRTFGRMMRSPAPTRLRLERTEATPGPTGGGVGFTLDEMTDIAEKLLAEIGLTTGFARIVLVIGHGSTSMNNPHESAHDCGACGGARGGPNARAFAQMLNDLRVRERLRGRGLTVPPETVFVGGMHNTSDESLTMYDLDRVPESHAAEFEVVRCDCERACDRDAHERTRRFRSAPLTQSFAAARRHVEERAEDLAQVRPEWGHASNAITVVGRRDWSRGLFLDRRAFLTSYDPSRDDAEHTVLMRILGAVFPVCAGINLEYYFSYVDNTGWGSGTKLPHNIAALVGVMDGAASDLRTGLPWQMVEIHEPVRSLFIIETTAEAMTRIMERNRGIGSLCRNGWVSLALLHPDTREVSVYRDGEFRPYWPQASTLPKAASSVDWYRGWRDHLEFAEIGNYSGVGSRE
jgi:uncharacterized protein YbcC (UPF0753/DUF2309 family)